MKVSPDLKFIIIVLICFGTLVAVAYFSGPKPTPFVFLVGVAAAIWAWKSLKEKDE